MTWPDGKRYVGDFKEGKRDGKGTLTLSNGDKYVGDFKENKVIWLENYLLQEQETEVRSRKRA